MDQSVSLMSAEVHFLDTDLVLIHIPLHLYSFFLQPILQLVAPTRSTYPAATEAVSASTNSVQTNLPWAYDNPFINISVTPVECSVACPRTLANELFIPIRDSLSVALRNQIVISQEDYIVIQVDGSGIEAGQRVLELTGPLALAGISIFFITTYFSDYILVPLRSRASVIAALEDRGFIFEESSEAFVNLTPLTSPAPHPESSSHSVSSSIDSPFEFQAFSSSLSDDTKPPATPPPSTISELETRTFALLGRRNVAPSVDATIRLIQCAGRRDSGGVRGETTHLGARNGASAAAANNYMTRMQLGIIRCLISTPRSRFFSVTLTDTEPASLLLENRLLAEFEDAGDEILLGSREDLLVPIILDLRQLPMESTGIVCGIAGRLLGAASTDYSSNSTSPNDQGIVEGDNYRLVELTPSNKLDTLGTNESSVIEMSYLSTAMAGSVMVAETELERAIEALRITI